jgi:hypothetical protein
VRLLLFPEITDNERSGAASFVTLKKLSGIAEYKCTVCVGVVVADVGKTGAVIFLAAADVSPLP